MLFLLLCAACFFPLAIYLLILSLVNRQHRPMLVSGTWDFAGLLFAVSGFLVFGVAGILIGVNDLLDLGSASVESAVAADTPTMQVSEGATSSAPAPLFSLVRPLAISWTLYLIVLVSGAIFLIWRQRRLTVVYCVNPVEFDRALANVLARRGIAREQAGRDVILPALGRRVVHLCVDPSPALRSVTLCWDNAAPEGREMIETELANELASVQTLDNPLSGWFLGIAALLLLSTCGLTALAILVALVGAR